jgi:integrase
MSTEKKKLPRGVRRLDDGRFVLYVTRQGKPVRKILTWDLLKELKVPVDETRLAQPGVSHAKDALIQLKASLLKERRTGAIAASARVRIGDLFCLIQDDYKQAGRKSLRDVKSRWKNHLKAAFADVAVGELTTDSIARYIRARQKDKATAGSINRELAVISRMLRLGQRTTPPKVIAAIPHFPRLTEGPAREGFIEQSEYDQLREHAYALWLRAMLACAYTFGFRKGELLSMRVRQIDLTAGTIALATSKNGRPRLVAMTSELKSLLALCISGKRADQYVFTRSDGQPVRDFRESWKNLFAAAKLPLRLFHDLRRSAVRNMVRRGVDRDTSMRISGHRTASVFARYNIQSLDDLTRAAQAIESGATATKTDIQASQPPQPEERLQ